MMMKPDWKDAPEWAQWLAMDDDGEWFWYELKPELRQTFWMHAVSGMSRTAKSSTNYANWKDSLERRSERMPDKSQSKVGLEGRT